MDNEKIIKALLPGAMVIVIYTDKLSLRQKFLVVFDKNDRGRGDDIKKGGLPGGGRDHNEPMVRVARRELMEETRIVTRDLGFAGLYQKRRFVDGKFVGENHNFVFVYETKNCILEPVSDTNAEVSRLEFHTIDEIIDLWNRKMIHEGSLRILLLYVQNAATGNLSNPVEYKGQKY